MTRRQSSIPTYLLPELDAKIEKLNKKATKLCIAPLSYLVVGTSLYTKNPIIGSKIELTIIQFENRSIKYDDWEFVATIQHTSHGNVIATLPNNTYDLSQFRNCPTYCDHCKTKRRRKDTYIVHNPQKGFKQVGRSCLADFVGDNSILQIMDAMNKFELIIKEFEHSDTDKMPPEAYVYEPILYLSYVAEAIKRFGWVSRSKAQQSYDPIATTKDEVLWNFEALKGEEYSVKSKAFMPCLESKELAQTAYKFFIDYAHENMERLTDYEHNLYIALFGETIEQRHLGIAASLIPYYQRKTEKLAEPQSVTNNFAGAEGEKLKNICVTLESSKVISTPGSLYAASTNLFTFKDSQGCTLLWWTHTNPDFHLNKEYQINCTIKKLSTFKGVKQTTITRVKKVG